MGEWLRETLPDFVDVASMLTSHAFVYGDGSFLRENDEYQPHTFVWFHRELRDEPEVPGSIDIVYEDERIVVVDKPPFLSSIPRGQHVMQSVVVKLRHALGLPELTPAHRLDRVTSGLLVLTKFKEWRGAYQMLFQDQSIEKVYRAIAPIDPNLALPVSVKNHIHKTHGILRAEVVDGARVNAQTRVELEQALGDGTGVYRLTPLTGRTHQLRLHMLGLGIPIVGDPLYPHALDTNIDDFTHPLQLLASELSFTDPVDGSHRTYVSDRRLPL